MCNSIKKQEKITLLTESINNGPENYALTDKGDLSNSIRVNIKKNSYGIFELSQSNLVDKIINYVGLEVSVSLKAR